MSIPSHSSASVVDVTITSLGGLGDGIADVNGKPLFVPKSCVGDRLRVNVTHQTAGEMRGEIAEIISGGADRVKAPCPHYADCGGCTLQHLESTAYRNFKTKTLISSIRQAGFEYDNPIIAFLDAASRRRVDFKLLHKDGAVSLSYYRLRSHTPIPISQCLILEPALQALLPTLTKAIGALPMARLATAVSVTAADSGTDVVLDLKKWEKDYIVPLQSLADTLKLARLTVRLPSYQLRVIVERATVSIDLGGFAVAIPPDAFLQATRAGQALMIEAMQGAAKGASYVADLFCGIGTYSFPLSKHAAVHAVENDAMMLEQMQMNIERHKLDKKMVTERRDLFKTPLTVKELTPFDMVAINPPRMGAKAQCEQLAASAVPVVAMASCNPATWSRDAKILKNGGFSLVSLQGIDQFVWSPHFEIVSVFRR